MKLFDIETKPRPDLVERYVQPLPPFDPAAVKYGNTKDLEKRGVIFKAAEDAYAQAAIDHMADAHERAALNPLTAQVIAIGVADSQPGADEVTVISNQDERELLREFWILFCSHAMAVESFVFWSGTADIGENFDIDMLVRRSWLLGIKVPQLVFNGRYYGNRLVDATGRYLLGRRGSYCTLSRAADELGLFTPESGLKPKKDDDPVRGENFWKWWEGSVADSSLSPTDQRFLATTYLQNDVLTLKAIVGRIF